MRCLISRIPIDIVEIVIISSDSYKLFEQLKKILPKFQEPKRVSRINDKMTHFYNNNGYFKYKLDGNYHREYNKPCIIQLKSYYVHEYRKFGHFSRDDGFTAMDIDCRRNNGTYYSHITILN